MMEFIIEKRVAAQAMSGISSGTVLGSDRWGIHCMFVRSHLSCCTSRSYICFLNT